MPISGQEKGLWVVGFVVTLGSLFFANSFYANWKTSNIISLPVPDCDLRQGTCISRLATGEVIQLSIRPTHMPVLTSLQLEVHIEKIPVKKVYLYFKGADMDMGEFRYALQHQKEGLYTAQPILPTCIQDNMVWHVVVNIETHRKRYSVPFVFINQRPAVV